MRIRPDYDVNANITLGCAYEYKGEFQKAFKIFEDGLNLDPNHGRLYAGLGRNAYYLGNYQDAINYFKKAIKVAYDREDKYSAMYYLPFAYEANGQQDKALEEWDKWLNEKMGLWRLEAATFIRERQNAE